MKKLEVYDPAMCCSTGVCGSDVDPALVTFAAGIDRLPIIVTDGHIESTGVYLARATGAQAGAECCGCRC